MKKLQVFASTKHGMQMMYLIAFVVFVFFVTYFVISFRGSSAPADQGSSTTTTTR